jgi:hypothetical protein
MKNTAWRLSAIVLAGLLLSTTARANIYATDVKLNGARNPVTGVPPVTNTITYILNEPATLGTTINISSGGTLFRTFSLGAGTNGTWLGSNTVVWDNNDNTSNQVPTGNYVIAVTPSSSGYTNWTQISHDTSPGNFVLAPRGLAVDDNSNSIYYGRIFIGNAAGRSITPLPAPTPGSNDTILKLNADSSFADEGPYGDGGYSIYDDGSADLPEKLRVGDDDRLYMNDFSSLGQIVAFNLTLTTNQTVLAPGNYSANPYSYLLGYGWAGMDITGAGTSDGLVWLGDGDTNGAGIWYWHLTNGIADPNDSTGTVAVPFGGKLSDAVTGGLMVDTNSDVFIGQYLTDPGDTNADCMVFLNTNAFGWSEAASLGVSDTSIDSRQKPKYVACALNGGPTTNGIQVLNALTGATVTNLDSTNQYFVTAWDNVGNLYAATQSPLHLGGLLHIFSPPDGVNQATTLALVHVEPVIESITDNRSSGSVTIEFLASRSDATTNFALVSGPVVSGPFQAVPSTFTALTNGLFTATTPTNGVAEFYQIERLPIQ